jgi:hypothetical protein
LRDIAHDALCDQLRDLDFDLFVLNYARSAMATRGTVPASRLVAEITRREGRLLEMMGMVARVKRELSDPEFEKKNDAKINALGLILASGK